MPTHTIDAVDVRSLAVILGVMGLLWGLLVALSWLIIGAFGGPFPGGAELVATIVGGAVYGVIAGAISAIVYNLATTFVTGIRIDLAADQA